MFSVALTIRDGKFGPGNSVSEIRSRKFSLGNLVSEINSRQFFGKNREMVSLISFFILSFFPSSLPPFLYLSLSFSLSLYFLIFLSPSLSFSRSLSFSLSLLLYLSYCLFSFFLSLSFLFLGKETRCVYFAFKIRDENGNFLEFPQKQTRLQRELFSQEFREPVDVLKLMFLKLIFYC
jgi:hypothetical protein